MSEAAYVQPTPLCARRLRRVIHELITGSKTELKVAVVTSRAEDAGPGWLAPLHAYLKAAFHKCVAPTSASTCITIMPLSMQHTSSLQPLVLQPACYVITSPCPM
jgi:hypothetical protein